MDPSLPVLNRDEALGRLEGDVELWSEIRDIWLEDVESLMEGVDRALGSQAADTLRRASHALKGASANVGAVRVASLAKSIELTALSADWKTLTESVAALRAEVEEAKIHLGRA